MSYNLEPLNENCYEGTTCLINKLNIKDSSKLKAVEGRITFAKAMKLESEQLKNSLMKMIIVQFTEQFLSRYMIGRENTERLTFQKKARSLQSIIRYPIF